MSDLVLCPTCGRRGSERWGNTGIEAESVRGVVGISGYLSTYACPDPFHDLADRAGELMEYYRLRERLDDLLPYTDEYGKTEIKLMMLRRALLDSMEAPRD